MGVYIYMYCIKKRGWRRECVHDTLIINPYTPKSKKKSSVKGRVGKRMCEWARYKYPKKPMPRAANISDGFANAV